MSTLGISKANVTGWSDSTIVLCWLRSHPGKFKPFVANRVASATRVLPPSAWLHVPTKDNPADCASRGMGAWELREHGLWWSGPPWLVMDPISIPHQPQNSEFSALPSEEAKSGVCTVVSSVPALGLEKKFSSYRTLLHVTAWLLRAAHNFWALIKHSPVDRSGCLVVASVKAAELFLIRESQLRSFPSEVSLLTATPPKPLATVGELNCSTG